MSDLLQRFLRLMNHADARDLLAQIEFLKLENEILRSRLPKQIRLTREERSRLLRCGRRIGAAVKDLITIVTPRTFARWMSGERRSDGGPPKMGRPRKPESVRALVLRLARETGWGYTRILGELRKLGIHDISRSTIVNILREHGFVPGPRRGDGSWEDFIYRHAKTIWACDFFSKKVWTRRGLVDHFVLMFINIQTRRVHVSPATPRPNEAWGRSRPVTSAATPPISRGIGRSA